MRCAWAFQGLPMHAPLGFRILGWRLLMPDELLGHNFLLRSRTSSSPVTRRLGQRLSCSRPHASASQPSPQHHAARRFDQHPQGNFQFQQPNKQSINHWVSELSPWTAATLSAEFLRWQTFQLPFPCPYALESAHPGDIEAIGPRLPWNVANHWTRILLMSPFMGRERDFLLTLFQLSIFNCNWTAATLECDRCWQKRAKSCVVNTPDFCFNCRSSAQVLKG